MSRFHYVKCLGDNTWLAKPANAGVFKKDVREAAPLTIKEAGRHGFKVDDPVYKLIPVEDVYQSDVATVTDHPEPPNPPFGSVAFDPQRRADDVAPDSGYTNGQRANIGQGTLAAYCFLADKPEAKAILINDIDLTEAPEEALTDLLANLMHYCHREGIEFMATVAMAETHFEAESGGATI
jgi:hypothetical protein